jgi:hypothetical protein
VSARALRVSMVSETFPPEINGVAMTVSQLVAQLGAGFPIPGYRELRFGAPASRRLRQSWQLQRPDTIYVATEGPLGWAAVKVAEQLGIPAVSGFHTQFHHYSRYYRLGWQQPLVYRYLKSLHSRTACTLVPTETMRRCRLRRGACIDPHSAPIEWHACRAG